MNTQFKDDGRPRKNKKEFKDLVYDLYLNKEELEKGLEEGRYWQGQLRVD
jgi:hypothetical protein